MTLGDLAEYQNGAAFKPADWEGNRGTPIVRIQNLTDPSKPLNKTTRKVKEQHRVRNGDILVSWSATLDAFIWARGEAWLNQHIFRVVPNEDLVERQFLFLLLKHEIAELIETEFLHGSTMKHINRGPFLGHRIALPPRPEQIRIVTRLRELVGSLDTAREELQRVPRLVRRYREAILAAAFRGDLTTDWRVENGQVAEVAWDQATLGDVAIEVRYGTSMKCHYKPETTPVLRIPNIANGAIDLSDLKYGAFNEAQMKRWALQSGDLLVIRSNGSLDLVGRAALVTEAVVGFLFAGYLIRLRLNQEQVDPEFVNLAFQEASTRARIERLAKSTSGVNNINSRQLKGLLFPTPPLLEQREIVGRVKGSFARVDAAAGEAARAESLLSRLERATLARVFRGELVPASSAAATVESVAAFRMPRRRATAKRARGGAA